MERAIAAVVGCLMAMGAAAQADKAALQREICAEAEQRYREVFGQPSSAAGVPVVTMYKHSFCPLSIAVAPGTTLRFVNVDRRTSHSVWFKAAGREESARLFGGEHVDTCRRGRMAIFAARIGNRRAWSARSLSGPRPRSVHWESRPRFPMNRESRSRAGYEGMIRDLS